MRTPSVAPTRTRLTFASVGNIETHVFGGLEPRGFPIARGIIGFNAPEPLVTEHTLGPEFVMVMHSDGVQSFRKWSDVTHGGHESASADARRLLLKSGKDTDDATVVVVKSEPQATP